MLRGCAWPENGYRKDAVTTQKIRGVVAARPAVAACGPRSRTWLHHQVCLFDRRRRCLRQVFIGRHDVQDIARPGTNVTVIQRRHRPQRQLPR